MNQLLQSYGYCLKDYFTTSRLHPIECCTRKQILLSQLSLCPLSIQGVEFIISVSVKNQYDRKNMCQLIFNNSKQFYSSCENQNYQFPEHIYIQVSLDSHLINIVLNSVLSKGQLQQYHIDEKMLLHVTSRANAYSMMSLSL